jgi:hypothetical protein
LVAKNSKSAVHKVETHEDESKPHFSTRSGAGTTSASTSSTSTTSAPETKPSSPGSADTSTVSTDDDSDAPTLHRRAGGESESSITPASGSTPSQGASGTTTSSNGSSTTASSRSGSASTDSDDAADRPTLKRRTAAEMKADQKKRDSARVTAGSELNDDPDRPTLHRGSVTMTPEQEIPPLRGLPKDMGQMVAVSDAKIGDQHDFRRIWEGSDERAQVLGKMQAFARAQLGAYKGVAAVAPAATPAPTNSGSTANRTVTPRSKTKTKQAAATVPPAPLANEELRGYTLSYGGAATFVYSATSPGAGGVSRYVTVVAQEDPATGLKVALASVTDSSHLDRTAWMRLVDVVDADASNRASLLMELRAQHTRQFALYRVIGAEADQVFVTGSME